MAAPGAGNIKVVVRVRPFNSREKDRQAKCIVSMQDAQTVLTPLPPDGKGKLHKATLDGSKTFAFDKSYWSFDRKDPHFADQEDLFTDLGKPLLDNAFQGYNNCIFAYGQTGSGKSYSMMGYREEQGIVPRICRDMFERIHGMQEREKNLTTTVEVSYLEIYNERVRDLLNPSTKGNLRVREHPSTGPYVEDLAKLLVRSFAEIDNLMDEGNKARTVAATNMNEASSRSHAVFSLTLTQRRHDVETNMDAEKVAKISLVDLAGSERASSTGAVGARLKEGAEINRSLSTLGRVIAALADISTNKNKTKGMQIPYRDSVLTWLLKDSLGGNSLTSMIAAISPADINYEETLSTLRYADSAKRIKNHAVVNEDPNARMIRELKEELAQLRSKLSGSGGVGMAPEEHYSADTPLEKQYVSLTNADGTVKRVSKAEIAEQLSQSEKLYVDLNQTWEEKMKKTEEIHKEREAALEELGISIEKGFVGLSTPKKMPHLVNLSDDPLLAECLIYNLKPGTTTVGHVESNSPSEGLTDGRPHSSADIRLNGSKILHDHCSFENVDGIVTVVPKDGAAVMVNGLRIESPKRLRSGYRVILGDFHIFRFSHPQEAREERAEQDVKGSLLKYSVTADQLAADGSPVSRRPGLSGHDRTSSTVSRAISEVDGDLRSPRAESPAPWRNHNRDSDWAFARREAVSAVLGPDRKTIDLTDEELDDLFADLQRVRAGRRTLPESRVLDFTNGGPGDTDTESVSSHPQQREKYLSNGTLDNFSLDTALTVPSTPLPSEEQESLKQTQAEMQSHLEQQKEDYQKQLPVAETGSVDLDEMRTEKARIESNLQQMKTEMEKRLIEQKQGFEKQLAALSRPARLLSRKKSGHGGLSEQDIFLAKHVLEHWRQRRYVSMAVAVLQNASTLKEAQVMSQQMDRHVVFQFAVVDAGHTFGSSYDLVLGGIGADESDDPDLENCAKPCLGIRVIDFKNGVIHLWSEKKLHRRVKEMRQMYAYHDRPEYMQHFRIENPFGEQSMPQYSRIGDVDVPLAAVFDSRVQDFTLDVYSPYTCSIVGIVRLDLEPSSAEAPEETLKFNVVMHEMVGFAEREGTNVHAQLVILGVPEEGNGATTTSLISDFSEGPVRFESVHSMSLALSAPRDARLRVSIFAKVTSMHLDKLLSWDDMRDAAPAYASGGARSKGKRTHSRLSEREYRLEERHDVFARVQILEIGEDGEYAPVEVVQKGTLDQGAYQLHQGLQRRVVVTLTHSSGDGLPWADITGFRAGSVKLLDEQGRLQDVDNSQADISLPLVSPVLIRNTSDGTTNVKVIGQWDSSAHGSALLDRPTVEQYKVQLSLKWEVSSQRVTRPMKFELVVAVQTRPRTWFRQSSLIAQLWHNLRVVHSTANNFSIRLKPAAVKRVGDLWRMDTSEEYVPGEETLSGWGPRSLSLILDFTRLRQEQRRTSEMEAARGFLSLDDLSAPSRPAISDDEDMTERQRILVQKYLSLWQNAPCAGETMVLTSASGAFDSSADTSNGYQASDSDPAPLVATVERHTKTPIVLKAGWLLSPDPSSTRWIRRYVELRRPYLHIYSNEGDEINVVNLTHSRIDAEPEVAKLLQRPNMRLQVWAVYATSSAWLFACRNDKERGEWIWAVDRSYGSDNSSGEQSSDVDGDET